MAKTFLISQANPISFRKLVEIDERYNTIPFDLKPTEKTINGCYYQKWEFLDATKIQFLSDYVCDINVYRLGTRLVAGNIVPIEKVNTIQGQTFKVYEAEFDFSDYGNGYFFAEITFTDDDDVLNVYQSQAWHTAPKWPETVLFEYRNSFNNYSVVFETGIVFNTRLEAQIREFSPQFDDELYVDQIHNSTQLSSIPFKQFKLVTYNLPDWALNLLNWVLNVDEKQVDGVYYEKTTGAKLDIQRVDGYEYGYATIDVVPVENFFFQRLKSGDMADGLYTIITKRLQWIDNAVNRTISGTFRANTNLRRIDLINKGLDAFTINVGTTNGGSEIASADITADDDTYTLIIHEFFDSDTTVYITGIDSAQLNLFVIFDQDDELAINISGGTSTGLLPKGFRGSFLELADGDLEANWDLASGLGKPNTGYANCAICDGRNGTPNLMDTYAIFVGISNIALLGSGVGSNSKTIAKTNLPNEGVGLFASFVNGTPGQTPSSTDRVARGRTISANPLDYEMMRAPSNVTNISGVSFPLGDGTGLDIRPKSIYELPFLAIN